MAYFICEVKDKDDNTVERAEFLGRNICAFEEYYYEKYVSLVIRFLSGQYMDFYLSKEQWNDYKHLKYSHGDNLFIGEEEFLLIASIDEKVASEEKGRIVATKKK